MSRPVLLAVAHGSAEPAAAVALTALIDRVATLAPQLTVELGYVDHTPPSVMQSLSRLAAAGRPVAVIPLLLSAASHSKSDIPGAITAVRAAHPGASIGYGRPLGPHPLLLAALDRLLGEAGAGADTGIVLVAAGSADPDANAEVAKTARLLWEWRDGGGAVEAAYASATRPTVADAVVRLRRLGYEDVALAPYFLAPGRLPPAGGSAGVRVAGLLGDTDEVARLVLVRYAEAVTGDLRMNCDVCRYRAPWPGRTAVAGTPQRPHKHPADQSAAGRMSGGL